MLADFPLNIEPRQLRVSRVQTRATNNYRSVRNACLRIFQTALRGRPRRNSTPFPRLYPVSRFRQATRISASVTGVPGLAYYDVTGILPPPIKGGFALLWPRQEK
ncbi:hypothetical protein CBM2586_A110072 [Cupriavidus phytorum]|uniref:Uncharacterized protein n=1 Tax=Cupriavidus taiwanensis TaxID=164546 RepID=A0A375C0B4_9BURK|nr:hypothetical protein CBM2586_A110072 [Cupriavidus taiwanensis]